MGMVYQGLTCNLHKTLYTFAMFDNESCRNAREILSNAGSVLCNDIFVYILFKITTNIVQFRNDPWVVYCDILRHVQLYLQR